MSTLRNAQTTYSQAFAALARFLTQEDINDVCVMEFEGGFIVTGSKLYVTGETIKRQIATRVLSNDELSRWIEGSKDATPHP